MSRHRPGHILRKVYNCTEREKISDLQTCQNFLSKNSHFLTNSDFFSYLPPKKNFHFVHQNSDNHFLVVSSISYVSSLPNAAVTTAQPTFPIIRSQRFTLFTIPFYAFTLFRFKIYNYNCTIPILELQTTFYNCTNCHQLHVKICPGDERSHHNRVTIYNLNTFRPTFIN